MKVLPRLYGHFADELIDSIEGKGYIAGGFARYCCSPASKVIPSNDIDIWSLTEDYKWIFSLFERYGPITDSDRSIDCIWDIGFKHIKLSFIKPALPSGITENLIGTIKTWGPPSELIDNFDLTICGAYISSLEECTVLDSFTSDEMGQVLNTHKITSSIKTLQRCVKYMSKGYSLPNMTILKLLQHWETDTNKEQIIKMITTNPQVVSLSPLIAQGSS